jgi:Superinfection immunity protein
LSRLSPPIGCSLRIISIGAPARFGGWQNGGITALNLLTGWTVVGWVAALL